MAFTYGVLPRWINKTPKFSHYFAKGVDYFSAGLTPLESDNNFTLSCWFKADAAATAQTMFSVCDDSATNKRVRLMVNSSNARFQATNTTNQNADISGVVDGQWHNLVGVQSAYNSRYAYLDGTASAENTGSADMSTATLDRVGIAIRADSGNAQGYDGAIAECALWNVALETWEIGRLAAGESPLNIRPNELVLYVPAGKAPVDVVTATPFDITGTLQHRTGPSLINRMKMVNLLPVAVGTASDLVTGAGSVSVTGTVPVLDEQDLWYIMSVKYGRERLKDKY